MPQCACAKGIHTEVTYDPNGECSTCIVQQYLKLKKVLDFYLACMCTRGRVSVGAYTVCPLLFQLFACLRHVQGIVKHLEGSSVKKAACRWSECEFLHIECG